MHQVNISIDDVSPHPLSSVRVLDRCYELIDIFPDIKFTLFVPLAYWRQSGNTRTNVPLEIHQFPEFCKTIRNLSSKNFEIGYHGLWHGVPPNNNNDEFRDLNYDTARKKLNNMLYIQKLAGLDDKFSPIFRPPAWKMSPEAFKACHDVGIRIFAVSPKEVPQQTYAGADKNYDCVYYNCNPPFDPLRMYPRTEIVYHACEWDRNYLSAEKTKELIEFLKAHDSGYVPTVFSFMEPMIKWEQATNSRRS